METTNTIITPIFTHIPKATKQALIVLSEKPWLKEQAWYLAGGTALTLQCDHRISVDLDFFRSRKDIDQDLDFIATALSPDWITTNRKQDTLYGELQGTKISFIAYPYFVPKQPVIPYKFMNILDVRDIAVMKIIAISQRGTKRDFFDLYWYVKNREPLIDILGRVDRQYPKLSHNYHHIIKSLTYFEDAEENPEPQIYFDATWEQVKQYFFTIIPQLADKLF